MELIGQFEQAIRNYDEMLAAAQSLHDRGMELDGRVAASTLYSTPTAVVNPMRGRQLSEETLKLAEELGDRAVQARVLWNLLLVNLQDGNPQAAIEYGERSLALARALNLREQTAYTLSDLGWAYNVACRFDEAEARLSEAGGLWHELNNMPLLTNSLNTRMHNLYWSGRNQEALAVAAEGMEISRKIHNIWNMSGTLHLQGLVHLEFGQTAEALDELRSSGELAAEANAPVLAGWYSSDLIAAHAALGNLQEAGELYAKRLLPTEQVAMSLLRTPTLVGYARYEIAAGILDTAAATLATCHATGAVWDYLLGNAQASLALACKDAAQAIAIAAPLAEKARAAKVGQYLPEALWILGQAHALQGETAQARAALDEALTAAQAIGSVRWSARIAEAMK
jgi:tetratricopeptide (TPR) repeat protein